MEKSNSKIIKPKHRFIRLSEVMSRTGYGRTSIYRKMEDGSFPKSIKLVGPPIDHNVFDSRAVAWIETEVDAANAQIICRINGEEVQNQNTSDLLHKVPKIIEFVSSMITLNAGDVIMTGTPGKPKNMYDGDRVEVEIEGIGILSNTIKNEL